VEFLRLETLPAIINDVTVGLIGTWCQAAGDASPSSRGV